MPYIETIETKRTTLSCAAWQLRRALTQTGLRDTVEAVIAAPDRDTKDMWEFTQSFKRLHPLVLSIATALGKTDIEIDDIFTLASSYIE